MPIQRYTGMYYVGAAVGVLHKLLLLFYRCRCFCKLSELFGTPIPINASKRALVTHANCENQRMKTLEIA